jgi:hypothetical protein
MNEIVARTHAPSTVDYDSRLLLLPIDCQARRYCGRSYFGVTTVVAVICFFAIDV